MKITTLDEPFVPLGSGLPRSPGLHLTDVMKEIEIDMGWRKKGWEHDQLYMAAEIGFMWEELLSFVFAERFAHRIGETSLDGIIGSPDGVGLDPEDENKLILEEYKCTWSSAKRCPSEVWKYLVQIKSYCHMLNLDTCIMRVLYLMGFYDGQGPVYRVSRFEFEEEELEMNWQMITQKAEEMRE